MSRLTVLTSTLILASAAHALSAQITTVPKENPLAIQRGWEQTCEAHVQAAQGHPVDLLFIGDSITQNFSEPPRPDWPLVGDIAWQKHYAHLNALNFGVSSDGTEHILWRMDHLPIRQFHPKVVILLAGTNDTQYSPEDIAAGVSAILARTQLFYPHARIVLMTITPTRRNKPVVDAANLLIQKLADSKTIFLFDLAPSMPPIGDNWLGVGYDHLHLTQQGYEIWATRLDALLAKIQQP